MCVAINICIQVVKKCRSLGKPVVIATQMLESMINSPSPTRAEASDIATAVYDGVDAVMLSAESASGSWPVEAVAMQQKIIRSVEASAAFRDRRISEQYIARVTTEQKLITTDAISKAARDVADAVGASAIVSFTCTGTDLHPVKF